MTTRALLDAVADEIAGDRNRRMEDAPARLASRPASGRTFADGDGRPVDLHVARNVEGLEGRGDYVVVKTGEAASRWRLTDELRTRFANAPADEPCHLAAKTGPSGYAVRAGDLAKAIADDDASWKKEVEAGAANYAKKAGSAPHDIGQILADMPGQVRDDAGRLVAPVWVSRADVRAACGKGGDETYGSALNKFCDAARQPIYDTAFKRTGEVATGAAGLARLDAAFGKAKHRSLWLDIGKLARIAALTPDGGRQLADLANGSLERRAAIEAAARRTRAERSRTGATKHKSQEGKTRAARAR